MKEKVFSDCIESAVLFLVFNRLDTTKEVFKAISQVKPPKFYLAVDGPREDREGESETVDLVKNYVLSNIDWDCEVHTLVRTKNLGCKTAVSEAISWFFEMESEGIILEDDVVPNIDFFYFVESNLKKYRDDSRVMMITGTNYISDPVSSVPYFFSEHMTIWGWGTWRRAWNLYDVNMKNWSTDDCKEYFRKKYFNSYIWKHFRDTFDSLRTSYIDTWDIQWVFTCLYNHGLCLTPSVNLVSNIGVYGTHGDGLTDSHFIKKYPLSVEEYQSFFPTVHTNYSYDFDLHQLKTKKVVRKRYFIAITKRIGLYSLLRMGYRLFR